MYKFRALGRSDDQIFFRRSLTFLCHEYGNSDAYSWSGPSFFFFKYYVLLRHVCLIRRSKRRSEFQRCRYVNYIISLILATHVSQ